MFVLLIWCILNLSFWEKNSYWNIKVKGGSIEGMDNYLVVFRFIYILYQYCILAKLFSKVNEWCYFEELIKLLWCNWKTWKTHLKHMWSPTYTHPHTRTLLSTNICTLLLWVFILTMWLIILTRCAYLVSECKDGNKWSGHYEWNSLGNHEDLQGHCTGTDLIS